MMATRSRFTAGTAVVLAVLLVVGGAYLIRATVFGPKTITAYFETATSIYPGDEVRVSGVQVGTIESIEPEGTHTRMTLAIDRNVPIPAEAQAVVVAQNLVAARYVQLTPPYRSEGATMADGGVIPLDQTAVPVEWDEVKDQLTRLATELGPESGVADTAVSRFIDSAANAMDGNGEKLRETLAQLSGVGRILADGSGDISDIVKNLQIFVSALRDSSQQIVTFQNRLASLTSVVDGSRSDLDAALSEFSIAVGEVQRFVAGSRDQTTEQVQRLSNVIGNVVEDPLILENLLHVAPNAFVNGYNIYNPTSGSALGAFVINNFANPLHFICSAIGGLENATAPETAKLCAQYLGPALRLMNFNLLPTPINPYLMPSANPADIEYSEEHLRPTDGTGPILPTEPPPSTSAYTGNIENPYPAPAPAPQPYTGRVPGAPAPGAQQQLPGALPVVPPNVPQSAENLLLPPVTVPGMAPPVGPDAPPPPPPGPPPAPGAPLPAEAGGTP